VWSGCEEEYMSYFVLNSVAGLGGGINGILCGEECGFTVRKII
jgi:hypothetical protein